MEEILNAGYRIVNVDTTLVLNAPKIGPISSDMRERVAELLGIAPENVGIKAKTPEGMAADHVAQAHAVVLLEHIDEPRAETKTQGELFDSRGRQQRRHPIQMTANLIANGPRFDLAGPAHEQRDAERAFPV